MKYLNKIIFINSASVKYAEIGLNGNVHLIGTQGVGKSTLLRAILFFYNANKNKLGIPSKKKRFDDYYFEYQNSYIIYEVIKDNIPFSILAYKVNGKVAFRFFKSEYKRTLFIDQNGKAENWEGIRRNFGKDIHYTKIISSYEEYRKILYGDNKSLNSEFKQYALMDSKQYQNIPRTIQNVLLNANLEAKDIKDTIISSISENEFKIDIENYSKTHLKDFETQIKDINLWFKKNRKGEITIRNQADKIINTYQTLNYLKKDTLKLTVNLANRLQYIKNENPNLFVSLSNEKNTLSILSDKTENLKNVHKKREQNIISDIKVLDQKIKEAKQKLIKYENQNIYTLIEKVAQKDTLTNEKEAKINEKQLLTSQFSGITEKYKNLISQNKNQYKEFENDKNAEINKAESTFSDEKLAIDTFYNDVIAKIKLANQEEITKNNNELKLLIDNENNIKRKKAELKHKIFFDDEIKNCKNVKTTLKKEISDAKTEISNANKEIKIVRKEWELEEVKINEKVKNILEKKQENQQKNSTEITQIQNNLKENKSSLYGWLNDTIPNWENTIGKVIDEKNVLFQTNLNPKKLELTKKLDENTTNFFGIELNLNAIDNRIKTVEEYQQEIENLTQKNVDIQNEIDKINEEKNNDLKNLKIKFRKKLSILNDSISENEYIISKNNQKLKTNKITLDEWIEKSASEKTKILQEKEESLDKIYSEKDTFTTNLERIEKAIAREISTKNNKKKTEIDSIENIKNTAIQKYKNSISKEKTTSDNRIKELEKQQNSELETKGADNKRVSEIEKRVSEIEKKLTFIKENETSVIEYQKDKRELFDKVPEFKISKADFVKKQDSLVKEQKIEQHKFDKKVKHQQEEVQIIDAKIKEFNTDLEAFKDFKTTDAFSSIEDYFSKEIQKNNTETNTSKTGISAVLIIEELTQKYYGSIQKLNDLKQNINLFTGNFEEQNIFKFKINLNEDTEFYDFAITLKEFINEDKIKEFEKRVNEHFASIVEQIARDTKEIISKEAEIEKTIRKINTDFRTKNFVEAIKNMEMRTQESSNPIVKLLIEIKNFNDENSDLLGIENLFTTNESGNKNNKAIDLLKLLVKEINKSKKSSLTLSESFDLQFRIVENDNDSGWVEKLSNVGSEGTDVLAKAMINISLLNVFKNNASKKDESFKLHCMMDEIGRLHPNNIKGILGFANQRNILLINGSPTSQNATNYKYTYRLSKEQSKTDRKKYITKITQLVKVTAKVLN
ncbi:DNA-binding protein [Tenacibaculum dicentrarchi]|uniref:DNA-binding protein n=1 Tax=Tenacibaculum dicentrarchi TaxID=669041 RepID=A0ABM9NWK4_9FLAO|nr:DNA-binding protein [Tenacibaculum dicentrarchi]